MKKLILLMTLVLLAGCSKEEVVETTEEDPMSQYLSSRDISFTAYGDKVTLSLRDNEAFAEISDTEAVIVPDVYDSAEVHVDYIQGNSLNDYAKAYYNSIEEATSSELEDNTFTTNDNFYGFVKTEKNSYVMVTSDKELEDYCRELLDRFELGGTNE